jgi:acetyl esterase/lipase
MRSRVLLTRVAGARGEADPLRPGSGKRSIDFAAHSGVESFTPMKLLKLLAASIGLIAASLAQTPSSPATLDAAAKAKLVPQPAPTCANVAYGPHPRQVLDFWQANSSGPTPVMFRIHGGGWVNGDKERVARLEDYLAAGISVVSINYRFVTQAIQAGVQPPVQWPLADAARALQFVRSQAGTWNLDKIRIAATGGSAGACSSLWLAFHDDMADPKSSDPVARESTRLFCAAVSQAQTTLDPQQMHEWTPNSRYGGHAFGLMPDPTNLQTRDTQFSDFLAARDRLLPWIRLYSPFEHVTAGDPPIYMIYSTTPALGQDQPDPTHTSNFGVKLQEKLRAASIVSELVYPGAPDVKHPQLHDYVIATLTAK